MGRTTRAPNSLYNLEKQIAIHISREILVAAHRLPAYLERVRPRDALPQP